MIVISDVQVHCYLLKIITIVRNIRFPTLNEKSEQIPEITLDRQFRYYSRIKCHWISLKRNGGSNIHETLVEVM